jgi:hypothetical protein
VCDRTSASRHSERQRHRRGRPPGRHEGVVAGTVAHTLTVTYVDVNGDTTTGTLSVTAPGTFVTSFTVAKVLSITASVAPIGTQSLTTVFSTPGDRYYAKVVVQSGGVIGVSGGTVPKVLVSLDNGYSYSRPLTLASTGLLEMTTYAGGQTPQPTGVLLTFANATPLAVPLLGSLRLTGATVPGDVVVPATIPIDIVARKYPEVVSGNVASTPIVFTSGLGPKWGSISYSKSTPGLSTFNLQVEYLTSTSSWALIPDTDLSGNSTGTTTSPVDISNLNYTTYGTLRLKANLACAGVNCPTLNDWTLAAPVIVVLDGRGYEWPVNHPPAVLLTNENVVRRFPRANDNPGGDRCPSQCTSRLAQV